MRILIVTAGSRGDVAPFTGLGRRLLDVGHRVTVAAHPPFASLVGGCGLGYRPLIGLFEIPHPSLWVRTDLLAQLPHPPPAR